MHASRLIDCFDIGIDIMIQQNADWAFIPYCALLHDLVMNNWMIGSLSRLCTELLSSRARSTTPPVFPASQSRGTVWSLRPCLRSSLVDRSQPGSLVVASALLLLKAFQGRRRAESVGVSCMAACVRIPRGEVRLLNVSFGLQSETHRQEHRLGS